MSNLIICEKPSVAGNVCDALKNREKFNRKDGYFESENYIITWLFGHLLELKEVNDYEGEKKKWSDIKLPYIPEEFQYKVKDDPGVKKQFKIVKDLINNKNITAIYNCGDNDSEGQILVDEILMICKNKKETYRLILPDQTEKTVLSEIDAKRSNNDYKNFAAEGFSRQRMDWLYGINTTVLLSVKSGETLKCGRLIVPVVKKIYDVDMSIKNFVSTKYYQAESNVNGIKLTVAEKFKNSEEASSIAEKLNNEKAIVQEINSKDVTKKPGKLFSLTSLQKFMNKNYKMAADETLKICQALYEKKFTTYPRTDAEYLSEEEKEKTKEIINSLNDENLLFKDEKSIFDSSKVEAHSAITPTTKTPVDLNEKEKLVYEVITNRFKSNFTNEKCIIATTEMIIVCGDETFKFTGEIMKQEGFNKYESISKMKVLPKVEKGDILEHEFKSVEKETHPPKKMTQYALLNYLEFPFRDFKDQDEQDEVEEFNVKELGLGTPATRAEIIKKCCKKYIDDNNNILSITPLGIKLIETINKLHIDLYAEKTISLSKNLKEVRAGNMSLEDCLNSATDELNEICEKSKSIEIEKVQREVKEKEIIGVCPKCGKNVYESEKSFYCEGFKDDPKCNFSIWKDNKFFSIRGKKLTITIVKKLLKDKKVRVKGFKKKDKSSYDADVILDLSNDKYVNFSLSFDKGRG